MRLTIKGKNGTIPDAIKIHAEKKVNKLERYFHAPPVANLEEYLERGQHVLELTLEGDGVFLRSEERCSDLHAAVDKVVEKMERQVKRFKTRKRHDHQRPGLIKEAVADRSAGSSDSDNTDDDGAYMPRIVRRKRFPMKPMPAEEAALQMELVDHSFFLFHNEETGDVNVLYRRRNGDYGLIEPER